MKRVHYTFPDSSEVVIYNPKNFDAPSTAQVEGIKCTLKHEDEEARNRPPRGAYYFRKIRLGEAVSVAEEHILSKLNDMLADGRIPKPQNKEEQKALDNYFSRKIIHEAPKLSHNFMHLVMIDKW